MDKDADGGTDRHTRRMEMHTVIAAVWKGGHRLIRPQDYERFLELMKEKLPEGAEIKFQQMQATHEAPPLDEGER